MLVPAARSLSERSRLSASHQLAESTAGKGRGRLRPPAQTPVAMHRGRLQPAREHRPRKWLTPGTLQRSSPVPPAESPHPPDPRERRQPNTTARKSFSTTDGSSFMVLDSAEEARQQSLWGAAATGRWHGSRAGKSLEIPAGTVGCWPLGASLPASCAELPAAGRLSIHSRLSDRPSPGASSNRASRLPRAAPGSTERFSACSLE